MPFAVCRNSLFRKSRHKPNLESTSKYGFSPDLGGKNGGKKGEFRDWTTRFTESRGVLFDRISSSIHRTVVARIDLLLIQIAVCDRTVNMRLCYASVEIVSYPLNEYRSTVYCGLSLVVTKSKKRDKG